ncbi:SidA/IucD/PvdA family monooxygenase [Amycolatopsis sp. PS_44_ISF1]|uniref:lysine N(6)-hydroxylase/L-ornithine N(5)-oxygenase family protein n=1 Tax=Amycolatopsis sp. PS_44_ISF1 TaxID=2974917 RepID=UPI0028E0286F|nr:SidA/IucD/PvdA family monooxygenase [Amycolatopsis sp. PS_44_ISF1]MDT8912361.1 SidA/IucD/PvdA family monooxygenase [Amycolatopsis sp. PS_44_ISF1]
MDVLGIGFGPANIALAIALEEFGVDVSSVFLERRGGPGWQAAMMLNGSDIQHNAVRDLALPRNPRSRYTFLNYLFEHERLFEYLNVGLPFPLRKEYARYVVWAAEQFGGAVRYGTEVAALSTVTDAGRDLVEATLADGSVIRARAAVIAPGRPPRIPPAFREVDDPRVLHLTEYLNRIGDLVPGERPRVAVVGGSQSAVELTIDLDRRLQHVPGAEVHNIMRGFGYRQKDLSPFTNEVFYPGFIDYYYDSSEQSRRELDRELRYTNYSAADSDVIQALYTTMYEQGLDGEGRIKLVRNTEIESCTAAPEGIVLRQREVHRDTVSETRFDAVVLATGFLDLTPDGGEQFLPAMLAGVAAKVGRTASGHAAVGRAYDLGAATGATLPPIYLNGLCETTHGLGDAGSFSLLSLRAATIAESLAKVFTPITTAAGA